MLREAKGKKWLFIESDGALSAKFAEAGFGFDEGDKRLFHPLEAAYLAKIGKTHFENFASADSFVSARKKADKTFPFAFAAYFKIRQSGRLALPYMGKTNFFRVYAPGAGRLDSRPSQLVCLLPGRFPSAKSLSAQVKVAHLARLDLVIACGTPSGMKFYKISSFSF